MSTRSFSSVISAPILKQLEVDLSGRYDHYSTGFSHFSPKAGFKFTPIRQLALRGTWSKGFRAPSFAETSGQITGFTTYTPGGFQALSAPGPGPVHYVLLRRGEPGALVTADLLGGDPGSGLNWGPLRHHDDPEQSRRTVAGWVDLPFTVLCLDHGGAFVDGKTALRALLSTDG